KARQGSSCIIQLFRAPQGFGAGLKLLFPFVTEAVALVGGQSLDDKTALASALATDGETVEKVWGTSDFGLHFLFGLGFDAVARDVFPFAGAAFLHDFCG